MKKEHPEKHKRRAVVTKKMNSSFTSLFPYSLSSLTLS